MGVKNCAEHEFGTENMIAPLFGVVRDLENRQKSGFFKIGSKRLIQSFSADWPIFCFGADRATIYKLYKNRISKVWPVFSSVYAEKKISQNEHI